MLQQELMSQNSCWFWNISIVHVNFKINEKSTKSRKNSQFDKKMPQYIKTDTGVQGQTHDALYKLSRRILKQKNH